MQFLTRKCSVNAMIAAAMGVALFAQSEQDVMAGEARGSGKKTAEASRTTGVGAEPRKEFKESGEYPYIFRPVGYLATVGPAPMRLGPPAPMCSERTPPRLIEPKRPSVTLQSTKPPQQPPGPTYSSGGVGALYAPGGGPANGAVNAAGAGQGTVDFNRPPDEVMEFFQPQALNDQQRRLLLDPSFIPAPPVRVAPLIVPPQRIQAAPPSTATYNQN